MAAILRFINYSCTQASTRKSCRFEPAGYGRVLSAELAKTIWAKKLVLKRITTAIVNYHE